MPSHEQCCWKVPQNLDVVWAFYHAPMHCQLTALDRKDATQVLINLYRLSFGGTRSLPLRELIRQKEDNRRFAGRQAEKTGIMPHPVRILYQLGYIQMERKRDDIQLFLTPKAIARMQRNHG